MPADPEQLDPVEERLAQDIAQALTTIKVASGYTGDATVVRATTSMLDQSPDNLKTVLWADSAKPLPAPVGITAWRQRFEVCSYVRESESSKTPIDQRLIRAASDVRRALSVDLRRNGLCNVDNTFDETIYLTGGELSYSSARTYMVCEYRTLASDPRALAPAASNEQQFQGRAVLYLAPADDYGGAGAWRRFPNLTIVPTFEPVIDTVDADNRDGILRMGAANVIGYRQSYEITADYRNVELLRAQLGGGTLGTFSQAATPLIGVPHVVSEVDSVVPLHDATGAPILGLTSIDSVTLAGGGALAAGADYLVDADCLTEAVLKIPASSTIPPGSSVLVSMTPKAIAGRPIILPATQCNARVHARIFWMSSDGQIIAQPDFDALFTSITSSAAGSQPETNKFRLNVIDNGSDQPFGQYVLAAGDLPKRGF